MSRCFPYPPPGYSAKNDRNEALIESIKLQREREKAKAERKKERKREKIEKKRENKVNGKTNVSELGHGEKRKRNEEKTLKCTKDNVDMKGKYIRQTREDEAEQLERSGLTEEHEQPVCPQNPSYSSDSTQNSNKRRRQALPAGGISACGNILRIRLPSKKHEEPNATVNEERLCSTSVRTESTGKYNSEVGHGTSREELRSMETDVLRAKDLTPRLDNAQICSTSRGTGIYAQDNGITSTGSKVFVNGIQTLESLYKDLVDHWVAPILQSEGTDLDGEEWLFQRKHRDGERCKPSRDVLSIGSLNSNSNSNSWPHAQYLAEADIYALPFTVPF